MVNNKKRTLNELRQEKEYGYRQPETKITTTNYREAYEHIQELVKKYPNDYECGGKIRSYLIKLGLYGK